MSSNEPPPGCKSEVALLMGRIREEYEAAQQAVHGLARDTTRHRFITARMENMGALGRQIDKLVGEEIGIALVIDIMQEVDSVGANP